MGSAGTPVKERRNVIPCLLPVPLAGRHSLKPPRGDMRQVRRSGSHGVGLPPFQGPNRNPAATWARPRFLGAVSLTPPRPDRQNCRLPQHHRMLVQPRHACKKADRSGSRVHKTAASALSGDRTQLSSLGIVNSKKGVPAPRGPRHAATSSAVAACSKRQPRPMSVTGRRLCDAADTAERCSDTNHLPALPWVLRCIPGLYPR